MKTTFIATVLAVISSFSTIAQATGSVEPGIHRGLRRGPPSCERLVERDETKGAEADTVLSFIEDQLESGGSLFGNPVAQAAYDRMIKKKKVMTCMLDQCSVPDPPESPDRALCPDDDDERNRRGLRRRGGRGGFFAGPPRDGDGDAFDCEEDVFDAEEFIDELEGNFPDNRVAKMIVFAIEMRISLC